ATALCDDTTEVITMTTPEPVDPIPADDAPHAYVAVKRTHSLHADRPEWDHTAVVIPEWDHEELAYRRRLGEDLIPIGPDGDTGTRAITGEAEKLAAVRAIAAQWAEQSNPYQVDARVQRQIEDGRDILAIL